MSTAVIQAAATGTPQPWNEVSLVVQVCQALLHPLSLRNPVEVNQATRETFFHLAHEVLQVPLGEDGLS